MHSFIFHATATYHWDVLFNVSSCTGGICLVSVPSKSGIFIFWKMTVMISLSAMVVAKQCCKNKSFAMTKDHTLHGLFLDSLCHKKNFCCSAFKLELYQKIWFPFILQKIPSISPKAKPHKVSFVLQTHRCYYSCPHITINIFILNINCYSSWP